MARMQPTSERRDAREHEVQWRYAEPVARFRRFFGKETTCFRMVSVPKYVIRSETGDDAAKRGAETANRRPVWGLWDHPIPHRDVRGQ